MASPRNIPTAHSIQGYRAPSQSRRSLSANAFAAASSLDSIRSLELVPPLAITLAGTSTAPFEAASEGDAVLDPTGPFAAVEPPTGDTIDEPAPAAIGAPIPGEGTIIGAGDVLDTPEDPEPELGAAAAPEAGNPAGVAALDTLRPAAGGADPIPDAGVPTLVAGGSDNADPALDPAETP